MLYLNIAPFFVLVLFQFAGPLKLLIRWRSTIPQVKIKVICCNSSHIIRSIQMASALSKFLMFFMRFLFFMKLILVSRIMSPKIFGRHIVFAFAVCLSVRSYVRCPSALSLSALHRSATCVISTKLYKSDQYHLGCAHHLHVPLRCTKWPPELKIEKSCPAFTGQTCN
jgi:hypothetical protein